MSDESPRFVVDVMLGRLARWLRLLGYEAQYHPRWDDATIARLAARAQAIVLSRDRQLLARRLVRRGLLVDEDEVGAQLRLVVDTFGLACDESRLFSLCPVCNTRLESAEPADVARLVPPYVLATQPRFRRCPACGKVYWAGTHHALTRERLSKMLKHRASLSIDAKETADSLDEAPDGP